MAPAVTCICGECQKCKRREYMRDYYRRNPDKIRAIANRSRARRIEQVRAYDRARGFRVYDERKQAARTAITREIVAGRIVRQPCEVCGEPRSDAHHDDYDKPLDVRWLCRPHHMELHRKVA